jgi:hypothetical protein
VTPSVPLAEAEQPGETPDNDEQPEGQPQAQAPQSKSGEDALLKKAVEILNAGKPVAGKSGDRSPEGGRPGNLGPLNVPQPPLQ